MNVLSSPDILNRVVVIAIVSSVLLVVARILDIVGLVRHKTDDNGLTATSWFITMCSFVASLSGLYLCIGYNSVGIINDGVNCILVSTIPFMVWTASIIFKILFIIFAHNKICPNCCDGGKDNVKI